MTFCWNKGVNPPPPNKEKTASPNPPLCNLVVLLNIHSPDLEQKGYWVISQTFEMWAAWAGANLFPKSTMLFCCVADNETENRGSWSADVCSTAQDCPYPPTIFLRPTEVGTGYTLNQQRIPSDKVLTKKHTYRGWQIKVEGHMRRGLFYQESVKFAVGGYRSRGEVGADPPAEASPTTSSLFGFM
jgi:hypothetical protein